MALFQTTRWSLVLRTRDGGGEARQALEQLCRAYRPPVLAMVRRHAPTREQAEDLTQAFFAKFLELGSYAVADPGRGRFRTFLMTAVSRFLSNSSAHAHAAKRDVRTAMSLDDAGPGFEPSAPDDESPEREFERAWALTVLSRALQRLELEAANAGKRALFEALREFLVESPTTTDYAAAGAALGMRANTVAVAVHRLRSRLRELLRDELADTVAAEDEVDDEVRLLRSFLARPRPGH